VHSQGEDCTGNSAPLLVLPLQGGEIVIGPHMAMADAVLFHRAC
jgi:hypothetical protein